MKLLFFLLILPLCTFGQFFQLNGKEPDGSPDIHYYRFNNGIQFIEFDYLSSYHRRVNYLEQAQPRALTWEMVLGPPKPNVYLLRDTNGVIIKQYGSIDTLQLLSVAKSLEVAKTHNSFGSRFGSQVGFSSISTRYYPYYLISEGLDLSDAWNHHNSRTHGLIDSIGNIVLPPVYSIIYPEDKLFITIKGDTSELRDIHLKLQFASTEYRLQPSYYHSNHVDIIKGDRSGLMDSSGKIVVPCNYDLLVGSFNEYGLAEVRQQGKHGFVNRKGKQVIPCEYQSVGKFSEGLIDVRKNEKWGYIDTLGRTVIPFRYEIGIWFEEGLARVAKRDEAGYHFGYINTSGDEVIPLIYSNAKDFRDGFAEVELNGKWIKIDRNGNRK
jgi:hypothetical protein